MGKYDQYKESVFTHEEMQPMIIETDMTDIVERLRIGRETCGVDMCRIREAKSGCTCAEAADEIERLRAALSAVTELFKATEASAQFALSEVERLRKALRDCHHVLHKLMGIVPGNDTAVHEMAEAMKKARAALGEGK